MDRRAFFLLLRASVSVRPVLGGGLWKLWPAVRLAAATKRLGRGVIFAACCNRR